MNLLDLPNEILLLILKKLNAVEALFRHSGLHNRLDQVLFDAIYVRQLDFTVRPWDDSISPMDALVIDRVCANILPQIHEKVHELVVEPSAMECVLAAADYPKVSSLSLLDFPKNILLQHLTNNSSRIQQLLKTQITHLKVQVIPGTADDANEMNLLEWIFSLSKELVELTFHQAIAFEDRNVTVSPFSSTTCFSLKKLDIRLNTFEECLLIFDGRFPSLSHCLIYADKIFATSSVDNRGKLLKMKYFSLTSYVCTHVYDDLIAPFLQRMSNLEELLLFLTITRRDTSLVVDGNDLQKNILNHLPQLKKFHFSIYTYIYQLDPDFRIHVSDYPSIADLQQSFLDNRFGSVSSYIHPRSSNTIFSCHVYSLPFQFQTFTRLSCSFPSDTFSYVRWLCINDYISWDYLFFCKVNRCFPFVETLMICNSKPQEKSSSQQLPLVSFDRLIVLDLRLSHCDYVEQCLCKRYTNLPRLRQLEINYEQLIQLTNDFTNDPSEFNCLQIQCLTTSDCFVRSESFSRFFPLL